MAKKKDNKAEKKEEKKAEDVKVEETESKPDAPLYRYTMFTAVGAVPIASEHPTRKLLWDAIVNCKDDTEDLGLFHVDGANNLIELGIRPSHIIMVTAPYGDNPISRNEAQPQGRVVHARRPSRVVIGQPGGGPGAARMPIPQQGRKR